MRQWEGEAKRAGVGRQAARAPAAPASLPASDRQAAFALPVLQSKRTKKVGIVGKYGTRYGASLRKQVRRLWRARQAG